MNKLRLQRLADFLKKVKPAHFYLQTWCDIDGGKIDDGKIAKVGCKTTACAMGWAVNIPAFRKAGLRLMPETVNERAVPAFRGTEGFDAAEEFFRLSNAESRWLFDPTCYPRRELKDPKAVATRIRQLLKGHKLPNGPRFYR